MGRIWTGNNRAPWHDYTSRRIYHITLLKSAATPSFGMIAGDYRLPAGSPGGSYLKASPVGRIVKDCLKEISTIHPALKVYQYALMPDHLHIILSVEEVLDEILGRKLAAFKVMANTRANLPSIFERGFNDQILTTNRNLHTLYQYLRDNPRRLAVRMALPNYFQRVNRLVIDGIPCQAYGNIQLLRNPFKEPVVVHRKDSEETKNSNKARWLHSVANGGVLVSPFVSPAEKAIRRDAEDLGGKLILVTHEPLKERQKPAAHDFMLCCEGRCLIIAPEQPLAFDRSTCLKLNSLSTKLCNLY